MLTEIRKGESQVGQEEVTCVAGNYVMRCGGMEGKDYLEGQQEV